jgi:hypothetical protein
MIAFANDGHGMLGNLCGKIIRGNRWMISHHIFLAFAN